MMTAVDTGPASRQATRLTTERTLSSWELVAYAMLAVRFVQGFIYWGGGSRRFIYAPQKLDPHAASWMANKFQGAMPGAILGTGHIVNFLLHHFVLLYASIIIFSAMELISGLFLILGLLTRASALVTIGLSAALMFLFGWEGGTCLDEWTMAVCNFSMGAALFAAGSSALSLDAIITKRNPPLAATSWFRWIASGPLPARMFRPFAIGLLFITAAFVLLTYNYYRGSIVTAFHAGPTSPSIHHFMVSDAAVTANGSLTFTLYLDSGAADDPAHVVGVRLVDSANKPEAVWGPDDLSKLPQSAILNEYAYNKFEPALLGLAAGMGARARITLPPIQGETVTAGSEVEVRTIDDRVFTSPVTTGSAN